MAGWTAAQPTGDWGEAQGYQRCRRAARARPGANRRASWPTDAPGREYNCAGFAARLRDWARLGQLVARQGEMQGRQAVLVQTALSHEGPWQRELFAMFEGAIATQG